MFLIGHNSDEQRLVRRLRNGENAAMQEFLDLYAKQLAGICSRYVPDEENMKDVFQESLIHIITHISGFTYRGEGSLKAWASRIVVNESLKFLKEMKRQELIQLDVDVAEEPKAEDPPVSDVPPDEIHKMVSQLPTGYRTVLNLYVFENKSYQEIASLLGIKESSSSSQLNRAKNLLAKIIRQYNAKQIPR